MDLQLLAVAASLVFVGAVAQRVAGLGFAMLASPFLVLLLGPHEGVLLVNICGVVSSTLITPRVWKDINWSAFRWLAAFSVVGSVIGRAALGDTPTLIAGVLAMITLFAMQALAGAIRRLIRTSWPLNNPPILLMAGTEFVEENMKRANLDEEELLPKLRECGIRHRSEVACVILEPTGEVTVLRRGIPLDHRLLLDVRGIEHVPEEFFAAEP